jgi:hypothetical protein
MLKEARFRSEKYLRHVASLGCCICYQPAQAHHLLRAPGKGMGMKSGDDWTVPLCPSHHSELHADGNETRWLASRGIDGPVLAMRIHKEWSERNA